MATLTDIRVVPLSAELQFSQRFTLVNVKNKVSHPERGGQPKKWGRSCKAVVKLIEKEKHLHALRHTKL